MTALSFVVSILATYRLAHFIAREDGPFDVMSWIRGKIDVEQKTWIGRGLNCALCLSFWIALPIALIAGGNLLDWLGVAGGALVIHKLLYR